MRHQHRLIQGALISLSLATVLAFQACVPIPNFEKNGEENSSAELSAPYSYATGSQNEKTAIAILTSRCASCHRAGALYSLQNVTDINDMVKNGWVYPSDSVNSKIVRALDGYSGVSPMPPGTALLYNEKVAIKKWIDEVKMGPTDTRVPISVPPSLPPTTQYMGPVVSFRTQISPMLQTSCARCHGGIINGTYANLVNANSLWVLPGFPQYSTVYTTSRPAAPGQGFGGMPQIGSPEQQLTMTQYQTLQNWILQGAPNN